jgi:Gpi18-like mannosyltransferase
MELAQPRCAIEDASLGLLKPASAVEGFFSPGPTSRSSFWMVIAVVIASAMKIAIAWNTIGTNDVVTFYKFATSIQNHGLEWTYTHDISFNHPPLTAYFLIGIYKLAHLPLLEQNGITFPFLLRFPGIIADVVTVWAVFQIAQSLGSNLPKWALLVFVLSPVSLMITGFHGNTDPIMVAFLTLAALAAVRDNPILCGLFLALSIQVKIIPLLLLPIFVFYWAARRGAFKFLCPMLLASLALWSQPLFTFPLVFAKNVLSYGSFWGLWGVTYWLRQTGWSEFARVSYFHFTSAQSVVVTILKILIVSAVFLIAWRRRSLGRKNLLRSIAYAWVVFFIFSPGVCAQYLVWFAPFVLFLSPTFFGWVTATSSLFLFFFYNTIADKFPWYLAISYARQNREWTPWAAWPWGVLIAGLLVLWIDAKRKNPSLRLFSLEPFDPELAN